MGAVRTSSQKPYVHQAGNVEFRGFVSNTEVLKIIANSKALILPTQWYEGFPMSIVEAFSVGTPVLCSELGNAGSVVEEGVTGCKFATDAIDEIAQSVERWKLFTPLFVYRELRVFVRRTCFSKFNVMDILSRSVR